ncbi:SdiA-regulated domain-containing protein [Algoriphagus namhaensis]|uniref:SdiA-regulated domain-containing protein n=1 Tax=Algoriphagus namhaensis TaxID=915353 RepID=A0ABV8AV64_9BACT
MDYRFPAPYSLEELTVVNLPRKMAEVSGLEWTADNQLWAIEDESSSIYSLDPKSGEIINDKKFAKNTDIEDLLVIDGVAWVLESNGKLYEVKNPLQENQETETYSFPFKERRDFEAIVHWEGSDYIWVFCKDCKWDDGSKESSFYPFSLAEKEYLLDQSQKIKRKNFRNLPNLDDDKKFQMQPSGAAKHPLRDEIYIISSAGNWLATYDLEFELIDAFELDPSIFKQPEGITFDQTGNLYISNEGRGGAANLLVFPFRP